MAANSFDIEIVIELIIDGYTFRQIAEQLNIKLSTLHYHTSTPEHSARVSQALEISAQTYEEKAELILITAEASAYEMQRARELAQHYRWKAAKRSPKKYGDKIATEHSGEVKITSMTPDEREKRIAELKAKMDE